MNSVTPSWIDGIPILGHVKAMLYFYRNQWHYASDAFIGATHNTGVSLFGVFGGHLVGSAGGFAGNFAGALVGGLAGGIFADALMEKFTFNSYGYAVYANKLCNRNMNVDDWLDLQLLAFKDGLIGLLAFIAYSIDLPSLIYTENQDETDITIKMEKTDKVFEFDLNFNVICSEPVPHWIDGIPILGDVTTLIQYHRKDNNTAKTLKWIAHKTGVKCFGVLGGMSGCFRGSSIVGGMLGGLFVDVIISELTLSPYGYVRFAEKQWSQNMHENDKFKLLLWTLKDILTILKALLVYELYKITLHPYTNNENKFEVSRIGLMEKTERDVFGNEYVVAIQKDFSGGIYLLKIPEVMAGIGKEIKCSLDVCEKPELTEGTGYRIGYMIKVLKILISGSQVSHKMSVENILQLEPGDHIVYERSPVGLVHLYDHHAIVEALFPETGNPEKGKYRVYEQASSSNVNEFKWMGKAAIKELEKPFKAKTFFKKDHEDTDIPKEKRRKIAHYICHHSTSSELKKSYSVIFNNCEHFANFCATGIIESQQVQDFAAFIFQMCIIGGLHLSGIILIVFEYFMELWLAN